MSFGSSSDSGYGDDPSRKCEQKKRKKDEEQAGQRDERRTGDRVEQKNNESPKCGLFHEITRHFIPGTHLLPHRDDRQPATSATWL